MAQVNRRCGPHWHFPRCARDTLCRQLHLYLVADDGGDTHRQSVWSFWGKELKYTQLGVIQHLNWFHYAGNPDMQYVCH